MTVDMVIAALGCAVLYIAAMLVIACMSMEYGRSIFVGRATIACGLLILGTRYAYLIEIKDINRLSIYGTASIGMIALGIIIVCVEYLRRQDETDR